MAAEYELTLNDYLQILRRRAVHLVGAFVALLLITIVVAVVIPPVYQSTGTILIESQQIPTDLVQATVTSYADERIEVIRQRVMTRENLLRIIEKYQLFKDDQRDLATSERVDQLREFIRVELVSANMQNRQQSKAAIAFKVSFEYRNAEIAHKVANELVTLFLDENVKTRTERAVETTEFLAQEAERLRHELEKIENQVALYKQQHANALPEHLEMRMQMVQQSDAQMNELEREYKDTQERLRYLDVELSAAKSNAGQIMDSAGQAQLPMTELEKLRAEYARLSSTYKEDHPDIKALKRKIDALEKSQSAATATTGGDKAQASPPVNLLVAKIQAQIDAGNSRLASIDQQRKTLRARLGQLQNEIIRSPQVEHELSTLLRDYDTAKKKYDEVTSKRNTARIAENLEQENKAERFTLLEPPMMPDKPIKPDRKKIVVMGFLLAIAGSLGAIGAFETMDPRVRGAEALSAVAGIRPLAVVPYITTQAELRRRMHLNKYLAAAVVLVVIVVLLAVHFLAIPLDVLTYKVMARFS